MIVGTLMLLGTVSVSESLVPVLVDEVVIKDWVLGPNVIVFNTMAGVSDVLSFFEDMMLVCVEKVEVEADALVWDFIVSNVAVPVPVVVSLLEWSVLIIVEKGVVDILVVDSVVDKLMVLITLPVVVTDVWSIVDIWSSISCSCSKHLHSMQYAVLTFDKQQSPPSNLQIGIFVASSQYPSPVTSEKAHPMF